MPKDVKLDANGNLVRDGKDGFALVNTAETAVWLQHTIRYGKWWGAPHRGSQNTDPRNLTAGDKVAAAIDEERRTLRVLEQDGRITDVRVIGEQPQPGRVVTRATFRDVSTGETLRAKRNAGR